jgi:hypothetical protein
MYAAKGGAADNEPVDDGIVGADTNAGPAQDEEQPAAPALAQLGGDEGHGQDADVARRSHEHGDGRER